MGNDFKVFDVNNDEVFVAIEGHYAKLSDAKIVYEMDCKDLDKDDSLLITVAKNDYAEICSAVSFSVEEGEKFALAILNLCHAIKY